MAGVRIPSPMSMHVPSIAMNSNIRLAMILLSKNFPSLICFAVPPGRIEPGRFVLLECKMLMLMFLHSSEYRANVPPAMETSSSVHTYLR